VAQCSSRLLHIAMLEDSVHDILNSPNYNMSSPPYHPLYTELMQTLEELRAMRANIMEIKARAIQEEDEKKEANKADEDALGAMVKSLEQLEIKRDDSVRMVVKKPPMAKANKKQNTNTEEPKTPAKTLEKTANKDVVKPPQNNQKKDFKPASV